MPVRRAEALQLNYRLKTTASLTADIAAVVISHWAADGQTRLSQNRLPCENTHGQWRPYTHSVTTDPKAYYIDLRFELDTPASLSEAVWLDEITLYREIRYEPLYADIKPLSPNDTLYVLPKALTAKTTSSSPSRPSRASSPVRIGRGCGSIWETRLSFAICSTTTAFTSTARWLAILPACSKP